MNKREKILGVVVGSIVLTAVLFFGIRTVFLAPIKELNKKGLALRENLDKINAERRAYFADEDKVKNFTRETFSDDIDQATAKSGEMLTKQILLSGLHESDFSRSPVAPRKLRGASEIGWSVQGEGKLTNVINLLFLVEKSSYLHRIEDVVLGPGEVLGLVRVRFRYLTLVMQPAPIVDLKEIEPKFTLTSPERRIFDGIGLRDILRPFVKRAPAPGSANPATTSATPGGPETYRVVSLSEWMGKPEVHVRDLNNQKTLRYEPGDSLAGGTIAMVDYRPLSVPGAQGLKSFSRVIVQIGSEYWAVERGRTLAEKYKLAADQLPAQLTTISK